MHDSDLQRIQSCNKDFPATLPPADRVGLSLTVKLSLKISRWEIQNMDLS